ncbi:hypothetical protein G5714_020132 [Onychostoma macrolepis]|uniref:Uncharacterized protein n=1 Tax=Onychostoma macrolepis TaxID=369639 RepID=A0A7J6BYE8_9TELE|nr:hypothetical protein G5714_020132 [Onychostoma macrolepis]
MGSDGKAKETEVWKINKVQLIYDTSEMTHFISAYNPGKHTASTHHLSALVTPAGRSFVCSAQQTLTLISSDHQKGITGASSPQKGASQQSERPGTRSGEPIVRIAPDMRIRKRRASHALLNYDRPLKRICPSPRRSPPLTAPSLLLDASRGAQATSPLLRSLKVVVSSADPSVTHGLSVLEHVVLSDAVRVKWLFTAVSVTLPFIVLVIYGPFLQRRNKSGSRGASLTLLSEQNQCFSLCRRFSSPAAYKCITDQREQLEQTLPLVLGLILGLIIVITISVYHFHLKLSAVQQPQLPRDRSLYKNM